MPVKRQSSSVSPRRPAGGARSWSRARVGLVLGAALLAAKPASAQLSGDGFLFAPPPVTLSIRAGYDRALASSDIFSLSTEQLTLGRGSFSAPSVAVDLGVRVAPRLDVVAGVAFSPRNARSESRDFVGTDDLPIRQSTEFRRVPVTLGLKGYLLPRGRSIGRYAWVPARVAPYVGAGGGMMWHRFRQTGEFVDFETLDVFPDDYLTSGWTRTAHAMAGVEFSVGARTSLTAEGRYTWANAAMSDDFRRFDRIDLSGLAATAGLAFRF
jgi:hypothetical protein